MKLVKDTKVVRLREKKHTVQNVLKDALIENHRWKNVVIMAEDKDGYYHTSYSHTLASERIALAEVVKAQAMKQIMGDS
jgi:hypothetical protein